MAFDPILPHEKDNKKSIDDLKWYAFKFIAIFAIMIIALTIIKRLYPKTWVFKGYHPYIYIIAIYICTFLFGIVDNAILIFDNNNLEDLLSNYLKDDLLAAAIINIFTACIALYIGAGIQDIMGLALNTKLDPTAEQFAIGLLIGGGIVIGIYYIYKKITTSSNATRKTQDY